MIKNLTLALDDNLLLEARKLALQRRTTVNQMVRDYLAALVDREGHVRQARANLKKAFGSGIVEVGDGTWKREDLYER